MTEHYGKNEWGAGFIAFFVLFFLAVLATAGLMCWGLYEIARLVINLLTPTKEGKT